MPTNDNEYKLEIDLRQELLDLFNGVEFVNKFNPIVYRQSRINDNNKKVRCSCYNNMRNEGSSDCTSCLGVGYLWDEKILHGYRWIPRSSGLSSQSSYKSYGGRIGRLLGSDYIIIIPYYTRINKGDIIIIPKTDEDGSIYYPIQISEKLFVSDYMNRSFDKNKTDYTIVGVSAHS